MNWQPLAVRSVARDVVRGTSGRRKDGRRVCASLRMVLTVAALALIPAGAVHAQDVCAAGERRVDFPAGQISPYEVPPGVMSIRITAAGGKGGGNGGPGAVLTGMVQVAAGDVLRVLVGMEGEYGSDGGGGGGSFVGVVPQGTENENEAFSAGHLLVVAGGGGGAGLGLAGGAGGTLDGGDGAIYPGRGGGGKGGGADGTGGRAGGTGAGQGGGVTKDGTNGSANFSTGAGGGGAGGNGGNSIGNDGTTFGGMAAVSGGAGGAGRASDGGFGGGGGAGGGDGGGGGGGYAGGGGGGYSEGGGGGGSSFFAPNVTDKSLEATNAGDGYVFFCVPAPVLAFDPPSHDFGEVVVGTSSQQTVELENTGVADATELEVGIVEPPSNGFGIRNDTCGETLSAGERCEFTVMFTPSTLGRAEATWTVTSAEEVTATLPLTGRGVAPPTWTISGTITDDDDAPLPDVTVRLRGTHTRTATTGADGGYAFPELTDGGTYSVTPSLDGYTFTPPSARFETLARNRIANFTAAAVELTISGTVVDEDDQLLAGVTVALSGDAEAEVATDQAGAFAFDGLAWGGTYTITPRHADYTFTPESQEVPSLEEDTQVAFTATRRTWTISGTIRDASKTPLPNVTVTLTGGADANTTTDDEGRYRFEDLTHGDAYIVRPSRDGYTFTPASQELDALTEDETVDFIAEAVERTITGTVLDDEEAPLAGVTVTLNGDGQAEVLTGADGAFAFDGLAWGGTYTVTPTHADYHFTPESRELPSLEEDAQVSFSGTRLTAVYTRYFGEGAVGPFFDTTFALFNPGDEDAAATLTFAGEGGEIVPHPVTIPAGAQVVVDPETLLPEEWVGFATAIEADQVLVTSRTMRWDDRHYGRHESAGVATPQNEWWFTEGATGTFQLFYLLYNPGDQAAAVTATYYRGAEQGVATRTYTVGPHTRRTVFVNVAADGQTPDPDLGTTEAAAHIISTNGVPIVAERAMYLTTDAAQPLTAGTLAPGVTKPAMSWHFAEGATDFFDLFLLLANSSTAPVEATVRYLLPTGDPLARTYTLEPQSRRTIWVDNEDPALAQTQVAITVQSETPILAERAMWWGANGAWDGGHVSTGAARPATRWALAGLTLAGADDAEAYVLIANPNAAEAGATLTLITPNGARAPVSVPLGPWSRTTLRLRDLFPNVGEDAVAVLVESTAGESPVPLVVEGAAYASPDGRTLTTGSATPSLPLPE